MPVELVAMLAALILIAAILYSSVGHAGASGYLAAMALFGLAPSVMKPTALCLNTLVATIAFVRFQRAGFFDWNLFWPFAVGSIPAAFAGGAIHLPDSLYRPIVGTVLLLAAGRLLLATPKDILRVPKPPDRWLMVGVGVGLGFISGLTGVGGGIFLSPLLILLNWGQIRVVSGVSALFILVNSVSGLLGHLSSVAQVPSAIVFWAPAAAVGGLIGAEFGSRRVPTLTLRRLLSVVLVIAGLKMILS